MKPGKPVFFGTRDDTLVFGLPGNPVSAFVCFALFVRPALRVLAGACRDAAVGQAGPLPCAVARRALPAFETGERRLGTVLDGLDTTRVELADELLANVNTPADLDTLAP